MQYRKDQFEKMQYNPFGEDPEETETKISFGRLGNLFNELASYKPKKDIGRVAQYIMYMYDLKSPLRNFETDIDKRKRLSAELSHFDLADKKDSEIFESLAKLEKREVKESVLSFVRYQGSRDWQALVTNEQLFWEINQSIIMKYDDFNNDKQRLDSYDVKTKLSEKADKVIDVIEKYEMKLFSNDQDLRDVALVARSESSPEAFAQKFSGI